MGETRPAAVVGTFYAAGAAALRQEIAWCFEHRLGPGKRPPPLAAPADEMALALISPHAGYRYSGPVAAHAYRALEEANAPDVVVIIGPNHRMFGAPIAVPAARLWRTPLGMVTIDHVLAAALCEECAAVTIDDLAHGLEHSVEVQVPFVQFILGDNWRLLPIVMCEQDLAISQQLGYAIANVLQGRKAVIVASSDFTHYESHVSALHKDRFALRAIEDLDAQELSRAIERHGISMCGPGPVTAAITASRALGARRGKTLRYATSGEISGDYEQVVGYAAVALR